MGSTQSRIEVIGAVVVVTAVSPVFAQSSVTLYGVVDDAIAYVNNQLGHSNVYLRQGNLYSSRIGLRGPRIWAGGFLQSSICSRV